jgi:hypothetical protein
MAYSQGGLIAATDYNGFVAGTNQLNTVWSVGTGDAGYGQTAISQVSTGGTVTATQWATLINTLNTTLTHQSGSGSGIGATTAGSTIAYLSTLATNVNNSYTNRLNFAAQGATTTGAVYSPNITAANNTTYGTATVFQRVVTFSSGDAARYFFNAGGQINLVITSVSNNDGTARSADAASTIGTYLGGVSAFRAHSNAGRTGSGGTLNTNNTSFGYYNLTSSNVITQQVTSTNGTYTNTVAQVYFGSNGTNLAGNGDAGSVINIYLNFTDGHNNFAGGFNDTLNITINHRVDIVYPESTNLSNTWGTVTVS